MRSRRTTGELFHRSTDPPWESERRSLPAAPAGSGTRRLKSGGENPQSSLPMGRHRSLRSFPGCRQRLSHRNPEGSKRESPHRIAETEIVQIEGFQQKKRFINFHLLKGLKSRRVILLSVLRAWTVPRPGGGANNRKRQRRWSARSGHPEGPRALPANFQTAAPCHKAAKERSGRRTPSGRE